MAEQVNKLAFIDFYNGTMQDDIESQKAGRPIFRDVEMVRIRWAGNTKNEFHAPATDRSDRPIIDPMTNDKLWPRWFEHPDCADAYAAFKKGQAMATNGTPINEMTSLTEAKRAELKAINILTVDQLASLDGPALKRLGLEGNQLKEQARLYLERAAGASVDARHAAEREAMQRQIDELKAMIEGRSTEPAPASAKVARAKPKPETDVTASPFYAMDDESIRLWCKEADPAGEQPHHRLGHDGLVAFADALNKRLADAKSKAA